MNSKKAEEIIDANINMRGNLIPNILQNLTPMKWVPISEFMKIFNNC